LRVIASSEATADQLTLIGINKPIVINLGVDLDTFYHRDRVLDKDTFNFGLFFYNHPRKNPELVKNIVDHLSSNYNASNIYIFGNGFPDAPKVKVLENLNESEYAFKLSQLDLFIYVSKFEGFGLPPLEAMACGIPVISSKVGATEEYIVSNESGKLLEVDSGLLEWIYAINELVDDSSSRTKMALAGQKSVSKWGWDNTANQYIRFLFQESKI
jgi:glycosyltransferase involved in cell wall biosynthesis